MLGKSDVVKDLMGCEAKFRAIFENAYDPVIYLDTFGRILDVNKEALEVFGGSKKELVGKHFKKIGLFSLQDIPRLMKAFSKILAGETATLEIDVKNKRGHEMSLECLASPIREGGEIVGVMVIARDITEKRIVGEALRESEERYMTIFESANDVILTLDLKGNLTDVNRRVEAVSGYGRGELIGRNISRLKMFPPKSLAVIMKNFAKRMSGSNVPPYEVEIIKKGGGKLVVEISAMPLVWGSEVLGNIAILRDITERKKAEDKLRDSEERYMTIFESANDVILTLDLKGNLTDVNRRVEAVSGYGRGELIGRNISRLKMFPPKSLAVIMKNFAKRMSGSNVPPYEVEIIKKGGGKLVVEISAMPLRKGGRVIGDLAILRDITERKKSEEKLNAKIEELERFNKLMVGRELRMTELKERIRELEEIKMKKG